MSSKAAAKLRDLIDEKISPGAYSISKQSRIAVLAGGLSNEREVSFKTGNNCLAALHRLGYKNAELIDMDRDVVSDLRRRNIEAVYLALHGGYGEDGTVQAALELAGIPYTGSGMMASAIAMSKPMTKKILHASEIPTASYTCVWKDELEDMDAVMQEVKRHVPNMPVIVKPHNDGSSVGLCKASDDGELKAAIRKIATEYGGTLIEEFVTGQEITVGVLENLPAEHGVAKTNKHSYAWRDLIALPILELRPKSKSGLYDYEAKYTKGMTEFILPAELSEKTTRQVQEIALKTFRALGCRGFGRVDMIVDRQGKPHVLEVNTLPGMTDTSDLPAMAEYAGMTYDQLVEHILLTASLGK